MSKNNKTQPKRMSKVKKLATTTPATPITTEKKLIEKEMQVILNLENKQQSSIIKKALLKSNKDAARLSKKLLTLAPKGIPSKGITFQPSSASEMIHWVKVHDELIIRVRRAQETRKEKYQAERAAKKLKLIAFHEVMALVTTYLKKFESDNVKRAQKYELKQMELSLKRMEASLSIQVRFF